MARILILGAGAIGCVLGARLHETGHEVLLIARGEHAQRLSEAGLQLSGGGYGAPRLVPVPATTSPPKGYQPDLVILAVKTSDIPEAFREHGERLGDAPIVALQNGLEQDALVASFVGESRVVPCVTALDATFLEPGHVQCDRPGTLVLGPGPASDTAANHLEGAIDVARVEDINGARWTKLVINLGNVVPAITGLPFQKTSQHPTLSEAHARLMREGLAVARAEGVRLQSIPWTSPALLALFRLLPLGIARRVYAARARRVLDGPEFHGSTWQSIQRGKRPETEWLNGEVVRRGARHRVATPVNAAALACIEKEETMDAEVAARILLDAGRLR